MLDTSTLALLDEAFPAPVAATPLAVV